MTSPLLLVPTDFSPASDRALEQAIDLCRLMGGGLEVLHVHKVITSSVPPTLDIVPIPPAATEVGAGEAALADRVQRAKAAGVPCVGESRFGRPDDEIVRRAAETSARLIVIGSHGTSALRHLLMGSVTEAVLKHTRCPVVVVPTPR